MSRWLDLLRRPAAPPAAPFIVGVARSGTTLLRLMLDAHPELSIPPESYFLLPFLRRPEVELRAVTADEFCRAVSGFHTWPDLGISSELLADEIAKLPAFSVSEGARRVYALYTGSRGKARWGDKTPAYGHHMARIEQLLPEARFVHIVRDGRDVALSLRQQWFTPAGDMAGLARHWAETVRELRSEGSRRRHYLEIRYEELLRDTRVTLGKLCRFLDLPFDDAMLEYHRTAESRLGEVGDQRLPDGRVVTRESRLEKHRLAGSPPDESRIGVWREQLTADEKEAFSAVAGELLRELGYEA
ncbi:MAG: sulfotransferase [Thermoanaerobaculia bacterium]|jgi:hypothetical protein